MLYCFFSPRSRVGPLTSNRRFLHRSASDGGGGGGPGFGGGANAGGSDLRGDVPVLERGRTGGGWRASSSASLSRAADMRAGLRRDEERERRRISRERDISRRRRRYLR